MVSNSALHRRLLRRFVMALVIFSPVAAMTMWRPAASRAADPAVREATRVDSDRFCTAPLVGGKKPLLLNRR